MLRKATIKGIRDCGLAGLRNYLGLTLVSRVLT